MLDVCAHMQQLLQQAEVKGERPADLSFLPLSLSVACLLQQLPAGLAPPAGRDSLSFLQVDRLPQEELERRLASQLLEDPLCAFSFLCSVVRYVKMARCLLTLCHEHMTNCRTTEDTTQSVVQAVVDALPSMEEEEDDDADEEEDIQEQDTRHVMPPVDNSRTTVSAAVHQRPIVSKDDKKPQTVAVASRATDPAGIMRRAVSRDVGDGSAVLEIMNKYPADERIQSHGVRALKGVIRNSAASTEDPEDDRKPAPHELRLRKQHGLDESDESEDTKPVSQSQQPDASSRTAIQMVIDKMKQFPESLALQQDGLLSLAEFAHQAEEHIAVITSSGGIISIVDAMASLPDDVSANMAGLSVLAHPKIADETIVRVIPESRRLVLSAMERFPLNDQVQGLGCLALANLSLRQDASMVEIVSKGGLSIVIESMKRFSTTGLVQAAGCWFIAIISGKNDEMKVACLDAGALPACEKARLRFPTDPKVQKHAVQAIQAMLPDELIEQEEGGPPTSCKLQ